MRKLGKLSAAAFSFASIANSSFAAEYSVSDSSGIGDIIPFALGALLIVCVLFIGYKMDKSAENAPTYKPEKKRKKAKSEKKIEAKEREIYAEENKADVPYEEDENEYYESDNNFDYKSELDDETEYEEDDISLFSAENNQESSFDDIDDNISYESYEEPKEVETTIESEPVEPEPFVESKPTELEPNIESESEQDFGSTILFDSSKLNELNDIEDYETESAVQEPASIETFDNYEIGVQIQDDEEAGTEQSIELEPEEEFEYTDAVELDDKIDSLDDLDNLDINVPEIVKAEPQDAESFMNELNKYKEEAEEEDFGGFTTKSTPAEPEYEEEKVVEPVEEKHVKRYTKKKTTSSVDVEAPSGQMDIGFLNQMEQNLKKNQEERMKKLGVEVPEEPKKRGRKPKKQ